MSPQNIAIVMSPNLLWSPEGIESDYLEKVNSTAAVNAIVEAIVCDWSYFFPDEFALEDFYVTFTRDDVFPDNGGFPLHRDPPDREDTANLMSKSMHAGMGGSTAAHDTSMNRSLLVSDHQTHSRSSSHDTSLILLNSDDIKRSQSNSSLSDSSPPQQNSPKLPLRRKHNKQVAPTPPDTRFSRVNDGHPPSGYSLARSMTESKERFFRGIPNDDDNGHSTGGASTFLARPPVQQHTPPKHRHGSTENLFAKPDKPPRPAMPSVESQTLVRNAFKSKGLDRNGKPVALPRNILNVARSTENLSTAGTSFHGHSSGRETACSDSGDELEPVLLRETHHKSLANESGRSEKPAIPERPSSLIRSSYRQPVFDKFEAQTNDHSNGSGVKKAQSFRMSGSPSNSQKALGANTPARSLTTLERTHIYNVDKQQVEIIDVNDSNNGNGNGGSKTTPVKATNSLATAVGATLPPDDPKPKDVSTPEEKPIAREETKLTSSASLEAPSINPGSTDSGPPQSPRGHDPKLIKRPQIPAPPPPKAASNTGCSTTQANDTTVTAASTATSISPASQPPSTPPPVNATATATGDSTKL